MQSQDFTDYVLIAVFGLILILVLRIVYRSGKGFRDGYRGTDIKENRKKDKIKKQPQNTQTKYWLGQIIQTNTTYQHVGTEERIIDNIKSNGLVKRRLTIAREWKKTIAIDKETNSYYKVKLGVPYGLIEGEITKSLKETYGSTVEETKYFSEEVELEIAAESKIVLRVDWKIIWQNGEIEVLSDSNEKIRIPFKIVKGITFDQVQEKVN